LAQHLQYILNGGVSLLKKLLSLIETEDKKNPMTDEELAKRLGVGREKVNELRQAVDIPSYLIRRETVLIEALTAILEKEPGISQRKVVLELNKSGFQISAFGLNRYKQQIGELRNRLLHKTRPAAQRAARSVPAAAKTTAQRTTRRSH
jgi:hypothetical protein